MVNSTEVVRPRPGEGRGQGTKGFTAIVSDSSDMRAKALVWHQHQERRRRVMRR